jgi:hypothetical protein
VITWGHAPGALGIGVDPVVRAWIGANGTGQNCDYLLTTQRDSILGSIVPGTEIAFCGDGPCYSLRDATGHPDARVLATFPCLGGIGVLRNTWGGGQSVYLFGHILPDNAPQHNEIILSTIRTLANPIPASSFATLIVMAAALLISGATHDAAES